MLDIPLEPNEKLKGKPFHMQSQNLLQSVEMANNMGYDATDFV